MEDWYKIYWSLPEQENIDEDLGLKGKNISFFINEGLKTGVDIDTWEEF